MIKGKKILAICGSTRTKSSNRELINVIIELYHAKARIQILEDLDKIPHFNPDLDNDHPPQQVSYFRKQLKEADGILICTPEYAMGVPGTLKNALDWTVSSCEFSHKPVALITASSQGKKGHAALLETLKVIEAEIPDETQLLISFAKTKINSSAEITDEETLIAVKTLIEAFDKLIMESAIVNKY